MALSLPPRLALLTLFSTTATLYFLYKSRRRHRYLFNRLRGTLEAAGFQSSRNDSPRRGKIFFLSQSGTSKTLAQRLYGLLTLNDLPFDLVDPKDYEPEDLCKESLVLVVASTWENGGPPQNGSFLVNWLAESADDFRVGALVLKGCRYAVFGVGSGSYGETYNAVGRAVALKLRKLGAGELVSLGEVFNQWSNKIVQFLKGNLGQNGQSLECNGVESDCEDEDEYSEEDDDDDDELGENGGELQVVDLEDLAGKGPSRRSASG